MLTLCLVIYLQWSNCQRIDERRRHGPCTSNAIFAQQSPAVAPSRFLLFEVRTAPLYEPGPCLPLAPRARVVSSRGEVGRTVTNRAVLVTHIRDAVRATYTSSHARGHDFMLHLAAAPNLT